MTKTVRVRTRGGFTLLELMVVLGIIGTLAALAIPHYLTLTSKAKTPEAIRILHNIYTFELTYFANEDIYGSLVNIGWAPGPVSGQVRYSYRVSYTTTTFVAVASANLDRDADVDEWAINQSGDYSHRVRD